MGQYQTPPIPLQRKLVGKLGTNVHPDGAPEQQARMRLAQAKQVAWSLPVPTSTSKNAATAQTAGLAPDIKRCMRKLLVTATC